MAAALNIPFRNYDYTNNVAATNEEALTGNDKAAPMEPAIQPLAESAGISEKQAAYWTVDDAPPDTALLQDRQKEETQPLQQSQVQIDNNRREVNAEPALIACGDVGPNAIGGLATTEQHEKENIDHVTNLIKSMREHAIGIIKDMNDLEVDFLGQLGATDNGGGRNGDGNGCGGNVYNGATVPVLSLCGDGPTDSGCGGGDQPTTTAAPSVSGVEGGGAAGNCSLYSANDNWSRVPYYNRNNNNMQQNDGSDTGYVVNEWAMPLAASLRPSVSAREFMQQAHAAIRSWREQIESCKQILDAAMAQVAQNNLADSASESRCGAALYPGQTYAVVGNRAIDASVSTSNSNSDVDSLNSAFQLEGKIKKQAQNIANPHQSNSESDIDAWLKSLRGRATNTLDQPFI